MTNYNLFEIQEQGDSGWAHGRLYATGNANASASFHRGIDLSAGINVQGEIGGEFGKGVEASLAGGGRLTAGLNLQAAYPLDLFTEAGLVARLRAQAAAGAFLRAQLTLDSEVFAALLRDRMSGPWVDLAEIFLTEIEIGAGLWANAAVSIQLLAEAAIVGNFLPGPNVKPGFTCSFQYAAGYGYGTGINFRTNFGFKNPSNLLNRLSNQLVAILEREIETILPQLNETERSAAQKTLPLLRLVLPLVLRALYEEGKALVGSSTDKQSAASNSLLEGILHEAQEFIARQLWELAINKVNAYLKATPFGDTIADLSDEDAGQLLITLFNIKYAIEDLSDTDLSPADWVQAILDLLDDLITLASMLIPDSTRETWDDYLALGWAAVVIVNQLVSWVNETEDNKASFDLTAPVPLTSSGAIAAHVAKRIQKAPGVGLTLGDAIHFILLDDASHLDSLLKDVPESAPVLDFLSQVLGNSSSGSLLQVLFNGVSTLTETETSNMLLKMGSALSPIIETQILPHLLTPLETNAAPEVVEVIHQIVKPTLLSATRVIFPQMGNVGNADAAQKLREQISIVLLQSLTRLMLVSMEILTDHVATAGPPIMHDLANIARAGTGGPAVDAALVLLSPAAGIPHEWAPTHEDLADILDICADTLGYWNEHERQDWFQMTGDLIGVGLASGDADLDALWQSIRDSNPNDAVPTLKDKLEAFARRLASGIWDLVRYIAPKLFELFKQHFPRVFNDWIVQPFNAAVNETVRAIQQAAQWLDQEIDKLKEQIEQLAAEIQQAITKIAAKLQALSEYLLGQIDEAISQVREAGWQFVYSALFSNNLFKTLRDEWENYIVDGVRAVYDSVFDTVRWTLDSPLQMFRDVAIWIQEALRSQTGMLDANTVLANLRQRALSSPVLTLSLPIYFDVKVSETILGQRVEVNLGRIDLGTVLFPQNYIASTLVGMLMNSRELQEAVTVVVNEQNQILGKSNQVNILGAKLQNALNQDETTASINNLFTHQPLNLTILEVADGQTYTGSAPLTVVLQGANRTFLTNVLGVPPRVKLLVNGHEHSYSADNWVEEGGALVYRAAIVPSNTGLVPMPVLPATRYLNVDVPAGSQLKPIAGSNQVPRFEIVPSAPLPAIRGPVMIIPPPGTPLPSPRPGSLPPHLDELLKAFRERPAIPASDPFLGTKMETSGEGQSAAPVIVQKADLFSATLSERLSGYGWVPPSHLSDTILSRYVFRETIIAPPGVNRIDVIAVEGSGAAPVTQGTTFFLTK